MSEHTLGSWEVRISDSIGGPRPAVFEIWRDDGPGLAARMAILRYDATEEDASIMAAAPELLAAARGALLTIDRCVPAETAVPAPGISKILRAAIKKAEGGA